MTLVNKKRHLCREWMHQTLRWKEEGLHALHMHWRGNGKEIPSSNSIGIPISGRQIGYIKLGKKREEMHKYGEKWHFQSNLEKLHHEKQNKLQRIVKSKQITRFLYIRNLSSFAVTFQIRITSSNGKNKTRLSQQSCFLNVHCLKWV